jgi:DNA-binding LytR/AlgR family response regulator
MNQSKQSNTYNHESNLLSERLLLKNLILSRHPNFRIPFPLGNGKQELIPINKITHLRSQGVLSEVFLESHSREKIKIACTIGDCERLLSKFAFIRPHRSYLVNCSNIVHIHPKELNVLKLSCGSSISISRRRKFEIMTYLQEIGLFSLA